MKKLNCLFALITLACSMQANAAFVGGGVSIDGISVDTTGTASFMFSGFDYFIADAAVNDVTPFFTDDHFEDVIPGSAMSSVTVGSSLATADAFAGSTTSSSMGSADLAGNAFASTLAFLDFEVDGTGDVTVTFDISWFADIIGSVGSELVDLSISVFDPFGGLDEYFDFFDGFDGDVSISDSSTLALTFAVDGYDFGALELETAVLVDSGVAPVPVPAAVWLFVSGLMSLFGFSWRKRGAMVQ